MCDILCSTGWHLKLRDVCHQIREERRNTSQSLKSLWQTCGRSEWDMSKECLEGVLGERRAHRLHPRITQGTAQMTLTWMNTLHMETIRLQKLAGNLQKKTLVQETLVQMNGLKVSSVEVWLMWWWKSLYTSVHELHLLDQVPQLVLIRFPFYNNYGQIV